MRIGSVNILLRASRCLWRSGPQSTVLLTAIRSAHAGVPKAIPTRAPRHHLTSRQSASAAAYDDSAFQAHVQALAKAEEEVLKACEVASRDTAAITQHLQAAVELGHEMAPELLDRITEKPQATAEVTERRLLKFGATRQENCTPKVDHA
jgi:hypothetical protein